MWHCCQTLWIILDNLNPRNAVGAHGISPRLLRLSQPIMAEEITRLINVLIANRSWPDDTRSSNHQLCSIPSSLYTLLDVYFLSSRWIAKSYIDLHQKPTEKNHKTTPAEWMKERTNKSMLLFPIFLLYILSYTLITTTTKTIIIMIIIIIIIIIIITVITVTSLHILYRGVVIIGI